MTKPLYVAELTINHLGMVKIAKAMIAAAKNAGADYVKLKMKNVEKYYDSSMPDWRNFPFRLYRGSLELGREDFHELDAYCKQIGMPWFSTIHDAESLEFIESFDPPLYKIASMDISKSDLLRDVVEACQRRQKPLVASVGGKSMAQIENLFRAISAADIDAYVLHTVSIYPTPTGRGNINFMSHMKRQFEGESSRIRVGYSGHEVGISASILAGIRGAAMIERHFTLSRDFQIHHIEAAITPDEFQHMIALTKGALMEADAELRDIDTGEMQFLEKLDYSQFKAEETQ